MEQTKENHPCLNNLATAIQHVKSSLLSESAKSKQLQTELEILKSTVDLLKKENKSFNTSKTELQNRKLASENARLIDDLTHTKNEHYQSQLRWKQSENERQEATMLAAKLNSELKLLNEKFSRERQRIRDLEIQLENERIEKHMLLQCLKNAEDKIASAKFAISPTPSGTCNIPDSPGTRPANVL
ncbi:MAG: hypothetical protein AABZ06_00230 [Bdellovibrionota bacterium]